MALSIQDRDKISIVFYQGEYREKSKYGYVNYKQATVMLYDCFQKLEYLYLSKVAVVSTVAECSLLKDMLARLYPLLKIDVYADDEIVSCCKEYDYMIISGPRPRC